MKQPVVVIGGTRVRKAVRRKCLNCNKTFYPAETEAKRNQGRFCSISCGQRFKRLEVFTICPWCASPVHVKDGRIAHAPRYRYCDVTCRVLYNHAHEGERNKYRRHYSARQVYAFAKGKPQCIVPWCKRDKIHIHHLNHNPNDNRIKNLLAICDHHHSIYHQIMRRLGIRGGWQSE